MAFSIYVARNEERILDLSCNTDADVRLSDALLRMRRAAVRANHSEVSTALREIETVISEYDLAVDRVMLPLCFRTSGAETVARAARRAQLGFKIGFLNKRGNVPEQFDRKPVARPGHPNDLTPRERARRQDALRRLRERNNNN